MPVVYAVPVALATIAKVALVAPAGTVTVAGKLTSQGIPAVRWMTHPPKGAAVLSVIVPVEVPPAPMVVGLSVRLVMRSPTIVKTAFAPEWPSVR